MDRFLQIAVKSRLTTEILSRLRTARQQRIYHSRNSLGRVLRSNTFGRSFRSHWLGYVLLYTGILWWSLLHSWNFELPRHVCFLVCGDSVVVMCHFVACAFSGKLCATYLTVNCTFLRVVKCYLFWSYVHSDMNWGTSGGSQQITATTK